MIGVGLVGCGRIARMFHLPALLDLPDVRLLAVAEVDDDARAAAVAAAPGAAGRRDLAEVLALPEVEAVVLCLPTHLHADAAVAAFEAGRHVYVEKPLAADLAGSRQVERAWRASGRHGAVGFNFRFHPLHREARQLVAGGALGDVVALRGVFSSAPRDLPAWKRDRATGGGALLDLASHHIDLVRHLLGAEVTAVSATVRSHRSADDTATLDLHLDTGVVAQLLATGSAAASDRIEVLGTAATLVVDRMGRRRLTVAPAAPGGGGLAAARRVVVEGAAATLDGLRPPPEPSFSAALAAFAADCRGGGRSGATIADGVAAMAVVEAAERSAASGRLEPVAAPAHG